MPFNIGPLELIIVLVIALLVLGPGKLPEVGSALGKSIREFRKAATDVQDATRLDSPAQQPAQPAAVAQPSTTAPVAGAAPSAPAAPASPTAPDAVHPVGAPVSTAPAPEPNTLSGQSEPNELSVGPKS
ncbi:MAG TPA: twin-arginine translocase TatA/TatE family subunit [Candidatus Limnocylindrales bacterium]|nr:twin-arginine translocase TatA/TatE family subunit [Candidatus Limnocylindrales bacterium]